MLTLFRGTCYYFLSTLTPFISTYASLMKGDMPMHHVVFTYIPISSHLKNLAFMKKTVLFCIVAYMLGIHFLHAQVLNAPSKLHYFRNAPAYTTATLFWQDNSTSETGYVIEQSLDGQTWTTAAALAANTTSHDLVTDAVQTTLYRIKAIDATDQAISETVRLVGTGSPLEVYPEVPGIRTPKDTTVNGITFSMLQDQCPANPALGKATRISTVFSVQVRPAASETFLSSPVYQTSPQIRNHLPQNDPAHTGGHRPYGYALYGPTSTIPARTLHTKHWTNFDASENVVVRIKLTPNAQLPSPINMADVEIAPSPLNVQQIDATTLDVTLPPGQEFTRHYRIAINQKAWVRLSGRSENTIEAPLYIFINPVKPAPASAPTHEIKEFKNGQLVVFGPGIHLPNPKYQFLGEGANATCREMYAPGDSYLHYGFIFNNKGYNLTVWGRALYSDEMFAIYLDAEGYNWMSTTRTPWATQDCTHGNVWNLDLPWEARGSFHGKSPEPTVFEGFTNIGGRMGFLSSGGNGKLIGFKDVGYGGGTYQSGGSVGGFKVIYDGCLLANDDDVTYCHHDYTMNHCTTFNLFNGPSFQYGWETSGERDARGKIYNHTAWSSDRNPGKALGQNHGVFNLRFRLGKLNYHSGGIWENFDLWGQENIVFNLRIRDENEPDGALNHASIFSDQIYRNFTIRKHARNNNVLWGEKNSTKNQVSYLRFLHFDNVTIEGNRLDSITDGKYFDYNEGLLLHTVTFFTMPASIAAPTPGTAPIGRTIQLSHQNSRYIQTDSRLPYSLSPLCANATNAALGFKIVDAGDGYIALLAQNGYYVKADAKRYGYIYTEPDRLRNDPDTKTITDNAKFIWTDRGNNAFTLYSKALGLYLRVEKGSGPNMPLYAASDQIGTAETFQWTATADIALLPNRVEVENYATQQGIQVTPATDTDGNQQIGASAGNYLTFNVNVLKKGFYILSYRVASGSSTDGSIMLKSNNQLIHTAAIASTGGWTTWQTISDTVKLSEGVQEFRLDFAGGSGQLVNLNWFEVSVPKNVIPGNFEAEEYVSQVGIQTAVSPTEGRYVGFINNGDHITFRAVAPEESRFVISYRVSSGSAGGSLSLQVNNTEAGRLPVPSTGGWEKWTTVKDTVFIPKGTHTLRLTFIGTGTGFLYNIGSFEFTQLDQIHIVPSTIEAEDYMAQQGTILALTSDTGGGLQVTSIDNGDNLTYKINVTNEDFYEVSYRIQTPVAGSKITMLIQDQLVRTLTLPAATGWVTVKDTVRLSKGVQLLKLNFEGTQPNLFTFNKMEYKALRIAQIEGLIEAEAYITQTGIQTAVTTDTSGVSEVGFINNGDNLGFQTFVTKPGYYALSYRVASGGSGGTIDIQFNGISAGVTDIRNTGGWNKWITVTDTVELNAGFQIMQLQFVGKSGFLYNLNWLSFKYVNIHAIPGKIEAEAFAAQNGIQVQPTTDTGGGSEIGFIESGDYIDLDVQVKQSALYQVGFRVSSATAGGHIRILEGNTLLSTTSIRNTGGWNQWTTVNGLVRLEKGQHRLRLVFEGGTGFLFNFNWLQFTTSDIAIALQSKTTDNATNNQIQHALKLVNLASSALPLDDVTMRYWFTAEEFAALNVVYDSAQLGQQNLTGQFVAASPIRTGGHYYLETSFAPGTALTPLASSQINIRIQKSDKTAFDETDDYSYLLSDTLVSNTRMTVYKNGTLIWGTEPAVEAPHTAIVLEYRSNDINLSTRQLKPVFRLKNTGNTPIALSKLIVRYWFTGEGSRPVQYWTEWAAIGKEQVAGQVYATEIVLEEANRYLELTFPSTYIIPALSHTGDIQTRMAKTDNSLFNQSNDYSFADFLQYTAHPKVTVYIGDSLVWGEESKPKILAAFRTETPSVVLYPNPSPEEAFVQLEAEKQEVVTTTITDTKGSQLFSKQHSVAEGQQQLSVPIKSLAQGVYFMYIRSATIQKTIRIIVTR